MICVVIKGPALADAYRQMKQAAAYADLVELRLDYFDCLDPLSLKELKSSFPLPIIFTLRDPSQGGFYQGSEMSRLEAIRQLAELKPDYFDLESHLPIDFVNEIMNKNPEVTIMISYHDFSKTPEEIDILYQEMKKIPAPLYKFAFYANRTSDALKVLQFVKNGDGKINVMSMGQKGQITRILGTIFGGKMAYACLDEDSRTAPGQLSAQTLVETYRQPFLSRDTEIYGLIGDPIEGSISQDTHNFLFKSLSLNALYIKMAVKIDEVSEFIALAKNLGFRGLSVTMPLKEHLIPYMDELHPDAKAIGAVNTLLFHGKKIAGYNTDGIGCLNAIEEVQPVKEKKIVIIGSGGAAKAIAFEAGKRGGSITVLNRNLEKAIELAKRYKEYFPCRGMSLAKIDHCFEEGYDILINCTPNPMPVDPKYLHPNSLIMDITTKPLEIELLKQAEKKGCRIIYGYNMFVEQAIGQFALWFTGRIDLLQAKQILQKKAQEILH